MNRGHLWFYLSSFVVLRLRACGLPPALPGLVGWMRGFYRNAKNSLHVLQVQSVPWCDFDIRDEAGRCRGFIWKYEGRWACRVDEYPAQHPDSFKASKLLAEQLLARSSSIAV